MFTTTAPHRQSHLHGLRRADLAGAEWGPAKHDPEHPLRRDADAPLRTDLRDGDDARPDDN